MSARARHIEEMRFLVAHRCATLAEARAGLARLKWQAGQAALAKVQGPPEFIGMDAANAPDRTARGTVTTQDGHTQFWWDRD